MKRTKKTTAGTFERVYPLPRRFVEVDEDGGGKGIFYFHQVGDCLFGFLLAKNKVDTTHYPFISYVMKVLEARQNGCDMIVEEDQVVEFPGNLELRVLIDDNELIGSLVKIVYKGKKGQKKKYEVWKDTGTFYSNKEPQYGKSRSRKNRRKRKPGRATV